MGVWTVGSLFSGIGGLDVGFERAGFTVAWFCEADGFCRAVLAKHWPGVPCYEDVKAIHGLANAQGDERKHAGHASPGAEGRGATEPCCPVDVLIGGFPCQDVSHAGKRAGLDGARSGLWWEYRRLIGELRPRVAVMENVAGLFTQGIDAVLGSLAEIGYDAEWAVVRASDVGAPHRRERVFILAYPMADCDMRGCEGQRQSGVGRQQHQRHEPDGCGEAVSGEVGSVADAGGAGLPQSEPVAICGTGRRHEGGATQQLRGAPTRWPARPGEAQYEWEPPRVVASSRRAEPAMGGVPDGVPTGLPRWRRAALQALGNAVVPQVAEVVAWRVREILETA